MPDNGTWIMVTGATGGIGKALVGRLIADGNNVIAAARDPARLSRGTGPVRLMCLRLDVERADTIAAAAAEAAKIAGDGGLSGLVNMAGIIVEGPVEAIPPAELRRQLDINVVGPMGLTQALLPLLSPLPPPRRRKSPAIRDSCQPVPYRGEGRSTVQVRPRATAVPDRAPPRSHCCRRR